VKGAGGEESTLIVSVYRIFVVFWVTTSFIVSGSWRRTCVTIFGSTLKSSALVLQSLPCFDFLEGEADLILPNGLISNSRRMQDITEVNSVNRCPGRLWLFVLRTQWSSVGEIPRSLNQSEPSGVYNVSLH